MKEAFIKLVGQDITLASLDDLEIVKSEFKQNEPVRIQMYHVGAQKARSLPQLNTLMACIGLFAENAREPMYNTKEKAKFAIKVALDFRHPDRVAVRPDMTVVFEYRSFSFKDLKHMEACNIFERAYDFMAKELGITVEELVANAKAKMLKRR